MPTSATGAEAAPARANGFTLVELLVVITIIGVLSAAVVLTLPDGNGRLHDDAEALAARLVTARDLSIINGSDIGVRVDASGYGFDARTGDGWTPLPDRALAPRRWSSGVAALATIEGGDRLVFDSTGLATPAHIGLERGGVRAGVRVDGAGTVKIDAG